MILIKEINRENRNGMIIILYLTPDCLEFVEYSEERTV